MRILFPRANSRCTPPPPLVPVLLECIYLASALHRCSPAVSRRAHKALAPTLCPVHHPLNKTTGHLPRRLSCGIASCGRPIDASRSGMPPPVPVQMWQGCGLCVLLRRGFHTALLKGVRDLPASVGANGRCAVPKSCHCHCHCRCRVAPYSETIFGILDEGGISHGRDRGSNMSALCHDYALHIKMKIQACARPRREPSVVTTAQPAYPPRLRCYRP